LTDKMLTTYSKKGFIIIIWHWLKVTNHQQREAKIWEGGGVQKEKAIAALLQCHTEHQFAKREGKLLKARKISSARNVAGTFILAL
jgi:hypothetical protein